MSGAARFWEEQASTFPLAPGRGPQAVWVARSEQEQERQGLMLLFQRAWGGPPPPVPLTRLLAAIQTGRASEQPWRRDGAAGVAGSTWGAGGLLLRIEPLAGGDGGAGAVALLFEAAPPWAEAARWWCARLCAVVAPLLERLPRWLPAREPDDHSRRRQLELFCLASTEQRAAQDRPRALGPINGLLLPKPSCVPGMPGAIGVSAEFRACCAEALAVAPADVNILLHGESGTGKEIIARAVHQASGRRAGRFEGINCAALPESLFESELFGHRAGAFTGAASDKVGLLEAASGGTFFLDEIGDMPLALQIKLLRVMQEKRVRRIGELESRPVDVRFIAATHKDLLSEIESGNFRLDLYYRLKVVCLDLPPLRRRPEDVIHLLAAFLGRHGGGRQTARRIMEEALAALQAYRWPGNVRELENEASRLLALHPEAQLIRLEQLSPEVRAAATRSVDLADLATLRPLDEAAELLERYLIRKAIEACCGRKSNAARRLGLSRQGLYKKIRRYGMLDLLQLPSRPAQEGRDEAAGGDTASQGEILLEPSPALGAVAAAG